MTLDLNLEDQDVMDYVQGKIQEPPSTATIAAKSKYKKGEIKAKLMIRDSIHKSLVAYISKLGHYARECPFKVKKRKAPSGGNGQPFKRSRNSKYEESNVFDDKRNEFILVSALFVASPPNTMDV